VLLGVTQTPCGQRADRDQRQGEPNTEGQHHGDAEREFFQLETDQHNGERSRTRKQSSGESEDGNLVIGGASARKSLLNFRCMGKLMGILVIGRRVM